MNRFEDAKELVKMNEIIESESIDFGIGYKPMDDDLEPQKYAEHGYMRAQQQLLDKMLDKGIISVFDLKKIYRND